MESAVQDLHDDDEDEDEGRRRKKTTRKLEERQKDWKEVWDHKGRVGEQIGGDENGHRRVVGPWC